MTIKNFFFIILIAAITVPGTLWAQSCNDGYYPMENGIEYEITAYKKNDKVDQVTRNSIVDVFDDNGATVAVVHTEVTDGSGKETLNAEYEMTCQNGNITIDMKTLLKEKLASSLAENNTGADAVVNGTNMVMPNNVEVGQSLEDSEMDMEISAGSLNMDFYVKNFNRKVIGEETVTVPAGTFDCIIITGESETKMMISKKATSKLWLAKGVGLVKEENYNKKGKLTGHSVLTKFEK